MDKKENKDYTYKILNDILKQASLAIDSSKITIDKQESKYYKYKTLNDMLKQVPPAIDPLKLFRSPFLKSLIEEIPKKPNRMNTDDNK